MRVKLYEQELRRIKIVCLPTCVYYRPTSTYILHIPTRSIRAWQAADTISIIERQYDCTVIRFMLLTSIINLSLVSRILVMIQKHRVEVIHETAEAAALTDIVDPVHTESYLGRNTGGTVGDGRNERTNGGWLLHCTRIRLSSVSTSI